MGTSGQPFERNFAPSRETIWKKLARRRRGAEGKAGDNGGQDPMNSRPCYFLPILMSISSLQSAEPRLGAHTLAFYHVGGGGPPAGLSTHPTDTQPSGSTILALVARGRLADFTPATAPADNMGNPAAVQLGATQSYAPLWPRSGEALFAWESATGGRGHVFHAPMPHPDEITLAVVEVKHGGKIQDCQWRRAGKGRAHATLAVTTTGPAVLVAFWLGDDGSGSVKAVPGNGFAVIDSQLVSSNAVETVVAAREVSAAGTYDVTWSATPVQGAHLWLVAVQGAE